jgi:ketosteroid isomerase-like protein
MPNLRSLPALALLAACSPAPAAPAFDAPHQAALVDSVEGMLEEWRGAVGAMDVDRIASFYAPDSTFRWIEDGATRYLSSEQLGAAIRGMQGSVSAMEFTLVEPLVTPLAPGIAAVTTGFTQKFTDSSGVTGGYAGAISMTVVRRGDAWRFLVGHTSALAPAPKGR